MDKNKKVVLSLFSVAVIVFILIAFISSLPSLPLSETTHALIALASSMIILGVSISGIIYSLKLIKKGKMFFAISFFVLFIFFILFIGSAIISGIISEIFS